MTIDESDEQDVVVRPRLVTISIVLWALDAIAYLAGAALVMSTHSAIVDSLLKTAPKDITRDQINGQLTFEEFTALGVGVLTAVIVYLLMRGNRWARILLVVVALIQLACQLAFGIGIVPVAAGTLLGLVGLALLYLPSSNAYFAGLKRQA
ncbi:hypothetical protein [Kutzneria sp. NPDC052558]|uniref:hypothetical protein n=1 Tax=Kutzneria sp. NPDC052558 TaxID=3364121 RepID=UPI0037C677A5